MNVVRGNQPQPNDNGNNEQDQKVGLGSDEKGKRRRLHFRPRGIRIAGVRSIVLSMVTFAVASPIGAAIGIVLKKYADANDPSTELVVGFLQAIACGTFFYVTFIEILPKEINADGGEEEEEERDARDGRRLGNYMRMIKALCILIGFACMALMVRFIGHSHSHSHGGGNGTCTHEHEHGHGHAHGHGHGDAHRRK